MNREEIGQMESRLHEVVVRSRYMMSDKQKDEALEDMAGYLLDMNDRIKVLEQTIPRIIDSETVIGTR